ncbi:MAG: hypothetical protein BEN18_10300 [Epulopiscium sp. Nuni2H_MBin001]|nr:MAG: hypothetical protein BEN18_10300 [Epulopiscium sp. Nuni2H_MBin001]
MNPARLNNRIMIERQQFITDKFGISTKDFISYKTIWATINNLSAKEWWNAQNYGAENTLEITIRYSACPDIAITDRIKWNNRLFNINSVDNFMYKNESIKIRVTEVI